ncbi:unnamed protein product [Phaeothamnion confervicola]
MPIAADFGCGRWINGRMRLQQLLLEDRRGAPRVNLGAFRHLSCHHGGCRGGLPWAAWLCGSCLSGFQSFAMSLPADWPTDSPGLSFLFLPGCFLMARRLPLSYNCAVQPGGDDAEPRGQHPLFLLRQQEEDRGELVAATEPFRLRTVAG